MRKIAGILGVAGLLLSVAAIGFADPPAKKDKKDDTKSKTASQVAEEIFNNVDKHKHGFITKIEFKKADAQLMSALDQMAANGTIGKGKPSREKSDPKFGTFAFATGFTEADTDHDKKVTLSEFTDYASRAITAADEALREQAMIAAYENRAYNGGHFGRR